MVRWILDHDRSWLFVGLYLGLAVILSVFVSLFWLLFMALAHFALEWVRHRILRGEHGIQVPLNALWEVKLDLALVVVALVLALYMEVVLGILGLQSAARAGAAVQAGGRLGTRIAGWDQLIRGFLLTVDDLANVARAFVMRRGMAEEGAESDEGSGASGEDPVPWEPGGIGPRPPLLWAQPWGKGDWFAVGLAAVGLLLLVATPVFTDHDTASALAVLGEELRPLPGSR